MSDYTAFLRAKIKMASFKGFELKPEAAHPILFPHQRDIVRWAVLGGNRAIFASFGLGKSVMQIEWLRQIVNQFGGRGLIVCPLGVRQELIRDAAMLGVTLTFIRSASEMVDGQAFYITNYETVRDGKLDPALFSAVSLDEASVLRSFGSKTYQEFLPLFEGVRFKLVNTATPSPNRFKELIHYAGFLGVMDTGQALTRFFQRDSEKAGNLTLYPHKEQEFWLWVSSWAVFVQRPSDLGYSDDGYDLPPLDVRYHEVPSDYSKAGAAPASGTHGSSPIASTLPVVRLTVQMMPERTGGAGGLMCALTTSPHSARTASSASATAAITAASSPVQRPAASGRRCRQRRQER